MSALDVVIDGLMSRYMERVPDVGKVVDEMVGAQLLSNASEIENDHIAFRTMGVPQLGIASLEKIFLHYGFVRKDAYHFAQKKLDAYWYAPPAPKYPRIFISELRVPDLSQTSQDLIHSYTNEVATDPVDALDLDDGAAVDDFLHKSLWRRPTWKDYQILADENEYAAWVIYNRYYLNHFTVSVQNLPNGYATVNEFNTFLEGRGFRLNDSGGKAKASGDGLLIQSSTVAAMVSADFDDGAGGTEAHSISGSYVEFAERRVLPEFANLKGDQIKREHRREGFATANADKIFESTYRAQTDS